MSARARFAFAVAFAAVALYLILTLVSPYVRWLVGFTPWLYVSLEVLAGVFAIVRVIRDSRERLGWGLMAGALLAVGVGDVIDLAEARGGYLPLQGVSVVLYFAFFLLSFSSIVIIMRHRLAAVTASVWLDGIMVALLLIALGTAIALPPFDRVGGLDLFALGSILVPLALMAILVGAAVTLGRAPSFVWWLLFIAYLGMAVSNGLEFTAVASGRSSFSSPIDTFWPLGTMLIAVAIWRAGAPAPTRRASSGSVVLGPALFTVVSLLLVLLSEFDPGLRITEYFAIATIAAGSARLLVAVVDAERLRKSEAELAAGLEKARDAALQAAQARVSFLATMSHEIRTPMNAIIGLTDVVLDSKLESDQRELVEIVRRSGELLLDLINNVLDFSKLESGGLELERVPFDLVDATEESVTLLSITAEEKGLVLLCDFADGTPTWVEGDLTRLRQVLVNLVGNALKFTAQGEVVVTVSPLEGNLVRFAVTDSGIGIPEDKRDRLFQSFSQVDASTTRLYGGSGLGLAISQAIVTRMGGKIQVDSTVGEGSRFWFDIPLPRSATPPSEPGVVSLVGKSAMILDDNAANRRVLAAQLRRWGMACSDASTPLEFMQSLRTRAVPDIAILDMQLPGESGASVARRLRALKEWDGVPLMLLTSLASALTPDDRALFSAVLTKPVRSHALHRTVMQLVTGLPTSPQQAIETETTKGMSVLVVEDNLVNQRTAQVILERGGHTVTMADNGEQAVILVMNESYDVVLMDVHMPIMDGLQASRAIRAMGAAIVQPPIIALTASASAEDLYACEAAGMDLYLTKPIRSAELRHALDSVAAIPQDQLGQSHNPSAPEPKAPATTLFDPSLLAELDEEFRVELFASFADQCSLLALEMIEAAERGDAQRESFIAHKLRGSSATMGAARLSEVCTRLELATSTGTAAPNELLEEFHIVVRDTAQHLSTITV